MGPTSTVGVHPADFPLFAVDGQPAAVLVAPGGGCFTVVDVDFDGQRVQIERCINPGERVWVSVEAAMGMRV